MSLDPIKIDIDGSSAGFDDAAERTETILGRLERATEAAAAGFATIGDRLDRAGKALLPVSAAITAAVAGGFALANSAAGAGDKIAKGARAAGVSAETYQELGFAMGQVAGVSQDELGKALEFLTRRIGEAQAGSDAAAKSLAELGFSQEEIDSGAATTERVFGRLVERIEEAATPADAARLAAENLGRSAADLGGKLHGTEGAVGDLRERFRELGLAMSEEELNAAEEFKDKLDELQNQFAKIKNDIGTALIPAFISIGNALQDKVIPAVQSMVEKVRDFIQWFNDLPPGVQEAAGVIAGALGTAGPIMIALGKLSTAISLLIAKTGPIGLFIAAAVLLYKAWEEWGDDIMAAIGGALDWVTEKFNGFMDFITGIPGQLVEIGRNMIQGLIDGINEKWEELKAKVFSMAEALPNWMKDLLGMNSPSRVFHEIGVNIGEGLALGIEESVGRVRAAVEMAGGAAVDAAGGMAQEVLGALGGLFKGSKEIGAGIALVNTLIGATEALKLPFPANIAAFARTISTGMGAVQGIRGASSSGGGSSGAGRAAPAAAPEAPTQTMYLNFASDPFGAGERTARMIADQVNAAQRRGHRVLFQVGGA